MEAASAAIYGAGLKGFGGLDKEKQMKIEDGGRGGEWMD